MPLPALWLKSQASLCHDSTTIPLPPPTTTALENATNFCHLLRDVEEHQALLKREDSQQVTPTGTLKLAAHHTSLLGERARLHTLHLQVSPPIPGSPHKSRRKTHQQYLPGDL